MGSSEALRAAKVYHNLLKAAKKHIGKDESKTHFLDFIRSEFRKNSDKLEISLIQQKTRLARDYTFLLNSVHHHKELSRKAAIGNVMQLRHTLMLLPLDDEKKEIRGKMIQHKHGLTYFLQDLGKLPSPNQFGFAVKKDLLFSYNIAVDRTEEMKKVLGKSAASVGLQLPEVYQP